MDEVSKVAADSDLRTITVSVSIPAVLHIQPKVTTWVDGDRLPEWERLTSKLLGIPVSKLKGGNVAASKTIDSCGTAGFDMTDVDESF